MALRAPRKRTQPDHADETADRPDAPAAPDPARVAHLPAWEWVPAETPPPPTIAAPKHKKKRDGMPPPISLLLGIIGACVGTTLWAVVGPSDERLGGLLAPIVGICVGVAVRWRAVKSSVERPIMAVSITAIAVLVGQFAVERNIDTGRRDLPSSADIGRSIGLVQDALEQRPFIMLLWLAAIVMAGAIASQSEEI